MRNTRDEQSVAVASQLRRRSKETVVALMPPTLRPKHPTAAERIEARIGGVLSDMQTQFVSLVKAYDRRMRRWRMGFWLVVVVIVVGTLAAVIAYVVYVNVGLWEKLAKEAFGRHLAEARLVCGERLDNRVAATRADVLSGHTRSTWMAKCIQGELAKRYDGAGDSATGAAGKADKT